MLAPNRCAALRRQWHLADVGEVRFDVCFRGKTEIAVERRDFRF